MSLGCEITAAITNNMKEGEISQDNLGFALTVDEDTQKTDFHHPVPPKLITLWRTPEQLPGQT